MQHQNQPVACAGSIIALGDRLQGRSSHTILLGSAARHALFRTRSNLCEERVISLTAIDEMLFYIAE